MCSPPEAPKAVRLRAASDYEFWSRSEWTDVRRVYDLDFAEKRVMDPSLLYAAVAGSQDDDQTWQAIWHQPHTSRDARQPLAGSVILHE